MIKSKWIRLLLFIGLLGALLAIGIIGYVRNSIAHMPPYKKAVAVLYSNSKAKNVLGENIKIGFFVTGSILENGPEGNADLQIPVKGSKEEGWIYVKARKHYNVWHIFELQLLAKTSGMRIDLLPK